MLRCLVILALWLWAAPAAAQTPLAELPLGNAATFSENSHIIVTVQLPDGQADVAYAEAMAERHGVSVVAIWPLKALDILCFVFSVDGDTTRIIQDISNVAEVVNAYPVQTFETLVEATYRDKYVQIQDGLRQMQVLPVHRHTKGKGVVVALIDTAVALGHRDLQNQDVSSRNFVSRSKPETLAERHGTAMAAIIAADAKNGEGMVGVAPDVSLLALRACWEPKPGDKGVCNTFSLARALNFAILNNADVINLSLSGPRDPILRDLIEGALRRNISVVAAHPPLGGSALVDGIPGVVVAVATTDEGHIFAPGKEVLSAMPLDDYDFYTGSSVSAAHVSGALALLRATVPMASANELVAMLAIASRYGKQAVDLCAALEAFEGEAWNCK